MGSMYLTRHGIDCRAPFARQLETTIRSQAALCSLLGSDGDYRDLLSSFHRDAYCGDQITRFCFLPYFHAGWKLFPKPLQLTFEIPT